MTKLEFDTLIGFESILEEYSIANAIFLDSALQKTDFAEVWNLPKARILLTSIYKRFIEEKTKNFNLVQDRNIYLIKYQALLGINIELRKKLECK